jgi:hypothetical protein
MKTKDIRVNKELIMKYEPCLDGLANFNAHHTDISITELINSENISYEHKVWLLRHIVPPDLMVLWAIDSSFAAYEYSVIYVNNNIYADNALYYAANAANAPYYATNYYADAAYYAANAANAADSADSADTANYAVYAAVYAANGAANGANAQNERLQALLYLIENEG